MKRFFLALGCTLKLSLCLAGLSEFHNPAVKPIPGEIEAEITDKQFRLIPFNDVIGPTDKLHTGGSRLSMGHIGQYYSFRLRLSWSLLTPVFQHDNDSEMLETPIGRVADWQKHELAQAFIIPVGSSKFRLSFNVANNRLGDRGLDSVQEFIHELINDEYLLDQVDPSLTKDFISSDVSLSWIFPPFSQSFGGLLTLTYSDDFMFPQSSAELGFLWRIRNSFKIFLRGSHIWQRDSGFYQGLLEPERTQAQLSFQISNYWTPSFAASSVYLKGDKVSQAYEGLLSFCFNLF